MPNYLCLLYERKAKEVGRVVMKCNKVIDGVGDITEQDRVIFNHSLRETLRLERQDLKDKARSIWNTLVKPMLALPAPSDERLAARFTPTAPSKIRVSHSMVTVTKIREEYEKGTCTPILGHLRGWVSSDYPNRYRAFTKEALDEIGELAAEIRSLTEQCDGDSLTTVIPKEH